MEELKRHWFEYRQHDAPLFANGGSAYMAVRYDGKRAALFTQQLDLSDGTPREVDRDAGNALVGIHLSTDACLPATVDVKIGGTPVSRLTLFPGDKCLTLEDATCCHLDALQYHAVELSGAAVELTLVYCIFDDAVTDYIARTIHLYLVPEHLRSIHTKKQPLIGFGYGMGVVVSGDETTMAVAVMGGHSRMIDVYKVHQPISWRVRGRRTIEKVAAFKEELMAAAWHPHRMPEWCWDSDERADFPPPCASPKQAPSRVWWDEVLVTDGDAPTVSQHSGMVSLRLPEGDSVCFVASTGRGFVTVRGKPGRHVCFDAAKPCWTGSNAALIKALCHGS